MIYIVLGMHKSGTTMLSEILHKSGVDMGDFDLTVDYYSGQKLEREDTSHAIWDILDCRGKHSLDTLPPFDEQTIVNNLSPLELLLEKYDSKYDKWGFKEPRSVFVYPYIKQKIGNHKLICVYRHPFDVVLHYLQFFKYDIRKAFKALKAWKAYNDEIRSIIENSQIDVMLFNYKDFVEEHKSIERLSQFVGKELLDVRKPGKNKKKIQKSFHRTIAKLIISLNFYNWKETYDRLNFFSYKLKEQHV